MKMLSLIALGMLSIPALIKAQTIGPCHPYPGAAAGDVLTLISNYLNNDETPTVTEGTMANVTYGTAAIVTTNVAGVGAITYDDMVRRALTAVGSCALSDLGSMSGSYVTSDGQRTCYLFAGSAASCV
ncbi:hypothetical protein EMPS_06498 [Entomortierella parvispora]|uniref:Uncharacterized protein n=1 Tax=Entomortierella parvispora TaxID=205924 RepID=A0A9P3LXT0_9FUNG|nr:hypothetical protein EMPS_06498 [Entomortierella parvispora]